MDKKTTPKELIRLQKQAIAYIFPLDDGTPYYKLTNISKNNVDRLVKLLQSETKKAEVKGQIKVLKDAYKLKNPIARSNYVKAKLTQLQESEGEG